MSILDRFKAFFNNANTVNGLFGTFENRKIPERNTEGYLMAYKGWLYAGLSAIGEDVGGMELWIERKQNGGWEDYTEGWVVGSPLDVLKNPNELMTFNMLFELHQIYLDIVGTAFWYVPRNKLGIPAAIYPLAPHRVTIVPGVRHIY